MKELNVGDQLTIRGDISQITAIETPQSFNNLIDEKTYFIKTMNYGDVMLTDDDIANNKHIKFFKTKENRKFDVMNVYNSVT